MKKLIIVILAGLLFIPYIYNFYKLTECDFISGYKCEAIHSFGVIVPPMAYITVWFADDSELKK